MKRFRLWPRSLTGQLVLLAALALFAAQMINAQLLLGERRAVRTAQIVGPSVWRVTEINDRLNAGRPLPLLTSRMRVKLTPINTFPANLPRRPEIETALHKGLVENNVKVGSIITGLRRIPPDAPFLQGVRPDRAAAITRISSELLIGVELPGRGWVTLSLPWQRSERLLFWQIMGQTLILYCVVLLPLLWAGFRIARPLRRLARAASRFTPGDHSEPVAEEGPSDVSAVIAAYNALSLRVNAMLEEKDRMLGAIGHDLRTPLAALRVRIESVEDDEDRARMTDTIDEMNRTLEDILSLARLGRPSEPPTEVDLAALTEAVVDDFIDLGANVKAEEAERLTMRLRPSLMRRALRNLIENAVKYGGGAEVKLVPGPKTVEIKVCDRGPGIPEDKLAAVFDPFTRLETSRNRETGGIGLGLALARAIVREAGGEVTLRNRDGGGLTATIALPR